MDTSAEEFDAIEREVADNLAAPAVDSRKFLDVRLRRIRHLPIGVEQERQVGLLTDIAWQHHHLGDDPWRALEPIALAVLKARELAVAPLLRRALSIQGLVLGTCGNTRAALQALNEALELAERIADPMAVSAAWINMSVTFNFAALPREAWQCAKQGVAVLRTLPDSALRRSFLARALHLMAINALLLQEVGAGLEAAQEAVDQLSEPSDPSSGTRSASVPGRLSNEENAARSLAEATFAQLLVAKGHYAQARERALEAVSFAERSGSARADFQARSTLLFVDVHLGRVEEGLRELEALRATVGARLIELRQFLWLCAWAYERAGLHTKAAEAHREWTRRISKARMEGPERARGGSGDDSPDGGAGSAGPSLMQLAGRARVLLSKTRSWNGAPIGDRFRPFGLVVTWKT